MTKEKNLPASLRGNDFVSSTKGGTLRELNRDGDHVTDIPVPAGRHRVSRFMVGIGRAHLLVPGADVVCFPADQRFKPIDFGEMQYETAATQNFKVDEADRQKRRNDRLERQLSAQARRQTLVERALLRSRGPDPEPDSAPPEPPKPPKPPVVADEPPTP